MQFVTELQRDQNSHSSQSSYSLIMRSSLHIQESNVLWNGKLSTLKDWQPKPKPYMPVQRQHQHS